MPTNEKAQRSMAEQITGGVSIRYENGVMSSEGHVPLEHRDAVSSRLMTAYYSVASTAGTNQGTAAASTAGTNQGTAAPTPPQPARRVWTEAQRRKASRAGKARAAARRAEATIQAQKPTHHKAVATKRRHKKVALPVEAAMHAA